MMASGVLLVLAVFPGLPAVPFLLLGGGLGTAAWRMKKRAQPEAAAKAAAADEASGPAKESLETLLKVDPIAIEVGIGLAHLVAGGPASPLLQKIAAIRRHFAGTTGYLLPPVRVTDNMTLKGREYVLLIKGGEAGRYELRAGHDLAIATPRATAIDGTATTEPAFGLQALWVASDRVEVARVSGYTVVDPVNVLGTHFTELIRRQAWEVFSRQDAKAFCDRVAVDNPKAVEELVPKLLPLATVQRVLQNLLRECVSIRDGLTIIEALGEAAATTRNHVLLTEYTRQALRRSLVKPLLTPAGELRAWFLDSALEQAVESTVEHSETNSVAAVSPQVARDLASKIHRCVERPEIPVCLVASAGSRFFIRQLIETVLPNAWILSHNEVPAGVRVQSLGVIR
jgi:flagellar biosynthesis protein FlhA